MYLGGSVVVRRGIMQLCTYIRTPFQENQRRSWTCVSPRVYRLGDELKNTFPLLSNVRQVDHY